MSESKQPARSRRRPTRVSAGFVAACAFVGVGGGALAWQQITDERPDPVAVDAEVETFVPGPPTAASVARSTTSFDLVSRSVDDTVGDSDFAVSDVVSAEVEVDAAGFVTASLVVDEWTATDSDDWRFGDTGPRWSFDLDGDDDSEVVVETRVRDGELKSAVVGSAGVVRCLGEPGSDESTSTHSVRFDVSCIGNPKEFRFTGGFDYEDVNFDLADADVGPDAGWSPLLSNPAFTAPLVTVDPLRLFDSREGEGRREAGSTLEVAVTDVGGVPTDARAVVLNVTAIRPDTRGYVTVYPCGDELPLTSSLNYEPGATTPGAVVAKVGADGRVCLFNSAGLDLAVDLNGYIPRVSDVGSLPPARVFDSRESGRLDADSVTAIGLTDRLGVPGDAAGVIISVTAVQPEAQGYLTVFPCGDDVPTTANLTFRAGANASNAAVARVGDDGEVCFYTNRATDLVVDVTGFLPATTRLEPLPPDRLFDSREEGARVAGGDVVELVVTGRAGVPDEASGVILNVTAVNPAAVGYVTVYPCGTDVPLAANLTYAGGVNAPNAVVAKVGDGGAVCFYSFREIDLVVDVNGYIP